MGVIDPIIGYSQKITELTSKIKQCDDDVEDAEYEVIDEPTKTTCKTVYVIYTEKSGPIKWTFSRSEAKSYTSKNKSYKFKAVELL